MKIMDAWQITDAGREYIMTRGLPKNRIIIEIYSEKKLMETLNPRIKLFNGTDLEIPEYCASRIFQLPKERITKTLMKTKSGIVFAYAKIYQEAYWGAATMNIIFSDRPLFRFS
jgi:hypothetical protein